MSRISEIASQVQKVVQDGLKALLTHKFWRYTPHIILGLAIIVSTTFMFPYSQSYQFVHLNEGDVYIGSEIIAPFTFHINKSAEEYNRDKKIAAEKVPLVFTRVDSIEQNSLKKLDEFFQSIDAIQASVSPDSIKIRRLGDLLNNYSIIIERENLPFLLNGSLVAASVNNLSNNKTNKNVNHIAPGAKFKYELFKKNLKRILVDT
ncbi:MAG: hypothetical protein ACE5HI_01500, partial [bacterium]